MTAMLRILHCLGSLDRGGAETWLLRVLQNIDRTRFQLDFCCLSGRPGAYAPDAESLGSQVHLCPVDRPLVRFSRQFQTLLTSESYDIVHSHVHYFSGYLLWRAQAMGVQGRIAHSHNTSDGKDATWHRIAYRKVMSDWIGRYANAGIAASNEAAAALFGEDWSDDRRWRIIRCGVELEPFACGVDRDAVRKSLGIAPDSLVIGHVGRFDVQKNHEFFVELLPHLLHLRPDTRLLLVGDGPLRVGIMQQFDRHGLSPYVVYAGLRADVACLMGAMDVFVMPSLHEGLPVAGLEAQAAGLPCLFSDRITAEVNVVAELVRYLPLEAPKQVWAEAVRDMAGRGRLDSEERLRAFDRQGFSIAQSVQQLSELYREVAAG